MNQCYEFQPPGARRGEGGDVPWPGAVRPQPHRLPPLRPLPRTHPHRDQAQEGTVLRQGQRERKSVAQPLPKCANASSDTTTIIMVYSSQRFMSRVLHYGQPLVAKILSRHIWIGAQKIHRCKQWIILVNLHQKCNHRGLSKYAKSPHKWP